VRRKTRKRKLARLKTKLGLPDLEQAKAAVLASLRSRESRRSYEHSIDGFVAWYCSAPRLSFNKTVVTRYRIYLEDRQLAPGTVNVRLAAVRRLTYEAADAGLLSPDLAAGIRRVKSSKKLGMRLGNWLTANEARTLWRLPDADTLKGKRDRAILACSTSVGIQGKRPPSRQHAAIQGDFTVGTHQMDLDQWADRYPLSIDTCRLPSIQPKTTQADQRRSVTA
jgi:hypothetical protein